MANNNENKVLNVPHLRFPEFTDEWKESVLSDFVERVKRKNKNNLCKLPLTISAQYGLVDQISFFNKVIASENMSNYYLLHKGDFAYNKSYSSEYPWGAIKRLDCYEQGTLSSLYICFKPYSHVSSDFLTHYFETSKWHQGISEIAVEGARNHGLLNVGIQDFFETRHCLPQSLLEQEKIAKFLNLIEERIATQNKIIEDLKKLKSAIVEMLLCNQNGESFKLRDVGCFVRGLTYANEDVTENKAATTVIRANNLNYGNNVDKDEVVYVNKTPTASQILRKGDIVICMANGSSSLIGKNSYYPFNDGQSTIGAFCGIYRTSYPFVKWLMQSQRYKRLVYQSLQGGNGAIANLNGDDILNMSFPLIEKEKSQSIIFAIDAIEKSLMVNKSLQRLYYTQKSYLLKQIFI
ncbi:restriction endonuclease subunit S [Bacteroides fragilis]|uniref:restriction endonuclease subunit S n=1 Tax=Phocaeicola vulgatus TaxID=821 RepID=UPI001C3853F6|nr:restriction endonuclease subunit S [Phocaeicola vulgatus]MBV4188208.1 restriction endonuclease subunit S [Phocaeicola vulgatus]UVQ04263.1 restriction endonuclease subunit S [Bacteroides fragilis]